MNGWPFSRWLERLRRQAEARRKRAEEIQSFERTVVSLGIDVAERLAMQRLNADNAFHLGSAAEPDSIPDSVPNSLRQLFQAYRSVNWKGICIIGLDWWSPCPGLDGYFIMGLDTEQSLVCNSADGLVAVYEGDGQFDGIYPTVYHWILVLGADPAVLEE